MIVSLSRAETHILVLIGRGYTMKQIAALRGTSEHTVRYQTKKAREKTGTKTTAQLAAMVALRRAQMERVQL